MKKLILIAVFGIFVFASGTSFAGSTTINTVTPVVQTDDDPAAAKSADTEKKDASCEKKCDKESEKKCCDKDSAKKCCAKEEGSSSK